MAKTLLNGVNEVLKKVDILDEDSGLLESLSDSARQTFIDLAVQVINEVLDELYTVTKRSKPKQLKESTITLVADQQAYPLHTALVRLRREFDLIDESNNHTITILDEDGYHQIIIGDLEQDDTGLPNWAAIRPTDAQLFLDRKPTANDAGKEYKYRFDKDMELTDFDDPFPFTDPVFRGVVVAAAELWKGYRHQEFSEPLFKNALGRSARLLSKITNRTSWKPDKGVSNTTDPMRA